MSKDTIYSGDSFENDPFGYLDPRLRSQFMREGHNTTKEVFKRGYSPNKTGTPGYSAHSEGGYTAGMHGKANRGGVGNSSGPTGTVSDDRTMSTHEGGKGVGGKTGAASRRYKLSSFAKGRNKGGGRENSSSAGTGVARVSKQNTQSKGDFGASGASGDESSHYILGGSGTGTLGTSGPTPPASPQRAVLKRAGGQKNPFAGSRAPNSYRGLGKGFN